MHQKPVSVHMAAKREASTRQWYVIFEQGSLSDRLNLVQVAPPVLWGTKGKQPNTLFHTSWPVLSRPGHLVTETLSSHTIDLHRRSSQPMGLGDDTNSSGMWQRGPVRIEPRL